VYAGLDVTGGTAATGTTQGDRNGYTLTFTGAEKQLAPEVGKWYYRRSYFIRGFRGSL